MYDDDLPGGEQQDQARKLEELKNRIQTQIDDCESFIDSELVEFRSKASDLYYGRPYGDEIEGYSTVVSRDVMETIEWILAQLLRIFTGDRFCEFEPFGPEDVEGSEQQTDYVNHVLMQDCNGALLMYDWFKEALMHRTSVVHWGYCDYYEPVYETYTGIDDKALQGIMSEPDVQMIEHSMRVVVVPQPPMMTPQGPQPAPPMPMQLHDIRVRKVKSERKLKIEAIPGEEFIITTDARSIDEATLVGHKSRRTKSDLLKEGIPADIVDNLSGDEATDLNDEQALARSVDNTRSVNEPSDEEHYWLYTVYVKFDMDGDGMDERLRVRYVGKEIVDIDHAMEAPYADICPIRTPHRFIGLSYTDVVEDIQRIKTVLWRQGLDNLYLTNKPQREAVEGQVNLNDLTQAKVGGVIRVKQAGMVRDMQVPSALPQTLQMVQYIDNVREERTGTSAASQGRDADQIHETASGMAQMVSQAQMRVELVARLFAEGGLKRLFIGLYNAITRNQDPARMVRLRGKWVKIDPTEWRERNNAKVTVGLGVGTKDSQLKSLGGILTMQLDMLQRGLPLMTPDKIRHTMTKIIETAGYSNVDSFVARPEEIPPPPPPQPPESIVIAQMQMQIEADKRKTEMQRAQIDAQVAMAKVQADAQIKVAQIRADEAKAQREHALKVTEAASKEKQAEEQLEQNEQQFYDKLLHDAVMAREKLGADAAKAQAEAAKDEQLMAALGDGPAEGAEPESEDDAKG
ncbi:hypothetical protein [Sphingomonas sp.]|jgi:hypothetical protein|uniref:portal protein n=1 Tax=Sphingomonas sp. TaxID=28214 RepID=UPI003561EB7B